MRKKAGNDFERDFFKLMNNAVFGRLLINFLNILNFKILLLYRENYGIKTQANEDGTSFV